MATAREVYLAHLDDCDARMSKHPMRLRETVCPTDAARDRFATTRSPASQDSLPIAGTCDCRPAQSHNHTRPRKRHNPLSMDIVPCPTPKATLEPSQSPTAITPTANSNTEDQSASPTQIAIASVPLTVTTTTTTSTPSATASPKSTIEANCATLAVTDRNFGAEPVAECSHKHRLPCRLRMRRKKRLHLLEHCVNYGHSTVESLPPPRRLKRGSASPTSTATDTSTWPSCQTPCRTRRVQTKSPPNSPCRMN